jgi:predicted DNA-binding transcriptional regulator AlpA
MPAEPLRLCPADPAPTVDALRDLPVAEPGRLIRQAELFRRLAVSDATGHRLRAAGKIGPRPIRLGAGCLRYDLAQVLAWFRHPRPDGSLHDARSWPAVWAQLQREGRR